LQRRKGKVSPEFFSEKTSRLTKGETKNGFCFFGNGAPIDARID